MVYSRPVQPVSLIVATSNCKKEPTGGDETRTT